MTSMKVTRNLVAFLLFAVGGLLVLYGLLALLYTGEGSGGSSTYVKFAGEQIDAHLAGALSLAVAVAVIATGVVVARRGRRG